jgi:hypothetical protein
MTQAELSLEAIRYPIGKWQKPTSYDPSAVQHSIEVISNFPNIIAAETARLKDPQLDTTYRPGGWTIRQVVHHCADSHMNAFIRMKLALTEENPTIKPYFEDRWADMRDGRSMPVAASLNLLSGLHARWTILMQAMDDAQYMRSYIHPEQGREFRMYEVASLYAWHCSHHLTHITDLKERMGWI